MVDTDVVGKGDSVAVTADNVDHIFALLWHPESGWVVDWSSIRFRAAGLIVHSWFR